MLAVLDKLAMLTGQEEYDGGAFFVPFTMLALCTGLASMVPHVFVSNDGTVPTYTDERYSSPLFWYLVAAMFVLLLLIGLPPALALLDGYRLKDTVELPRFRSSSWGSDRAPLWLVTPLYWGGTGVMLFYLVRGVWRRFTRPIPFRSYRGARARSHR